MCSGAEIGMLVAAAAGIGMTAYGMATAPGAPTPVPPPPPASYTQYDSDGGVISRQVYDKNSNTWTTYGANSEPPKPTTEWATKLTGNYDEDVKDPLVKSEVERRFQEHAASDPKGINDHSGGWRFEEYQNMMGEKDRTLEQYNKDLEAYNTKYADWEKDKAAREADKEKLAGIRTQMLDNLNETPEDRKQAYEEYAKSFSDAAHRNVDERFQKAGRDADEDMNAKGMFGSRAYVDTKAELGKIQTQSDTDIATQATLAKETLANNDRTFWANMLNQIDSGARADSLARAQIDKNAADINNQNYAGTLGYYSAVNNNNLANWEAKRQRSAAYTQAGTGLANGLLYLYGNKANPSSFTPSATTSSFKVSPTKTSVGSYSLQ